MKNQENLIHLFIQNGDEDEVKFIEVDGAKFVPDADDPTKPMLGDDEKPVPYVEKNVDIEKKNPTDIDIASMSMEELAKLNPNISGGQEELEKLRQEAKDREEAEAKRIEEDAEKNNEWKTLAEQRKEKLDALENDGKKKGDLIEKLNLSIKTVLDATIATIPEDKQGLIPEDFTPRQKLEYITKNAKLLGAKVVGADGKVPKNDETPDLTEEGKLETELEELQAKETLSPAETDRMFDVAKQLKAERLKKA